VGTKVISDTAMFYGDKINSGQYDNGAWMDVLQIPWLTKLEQAQNFDIIIRTLWIDSSGWSKAIKTQWSHIKLLGLVDHPLSAHISKLTAEKQFAYIDDLQYLDGIMTLTEEEREWYQIAAPSKPVMKVGLPFPFESYETKYGELRKSDKDLIGLGVGASDNDRNFISNILAFQKLQLKNPGLKGVFLSIPSQLIPYCAYWADRVDNLYIHQRVEMAEYYEMLTRCKFVINLTDRNTPGRLQGEAAFFGVPVIGSNRLELQEELFPSLSVKPYELEKVVGLGQRLLDKPKIGQEMSEAAFKGLKEYSYENSKTKYENILARVKGE